MVQDALEAFIGADGRTERLVITGNNIRFPPTAALALGIAFNELATNAVKYGAFSNEAGSIRVAWARGRNAGFLDDRRHAGRPGMRGDLLCCHGRHLALIEGQTLDAALLDMNLDGNKTHQVAEALAPRGVPFAFVTGYTGEDRNVVDRDRPLLKMRSAAMRELNVSKSAFDFGWMAAIEDTGRHDWYEPLRRRLLTKR